MRHWSLSFAVAAIILTTPNAFSQIQCDTQTCTFTLSFDSANGAQFRFVTGAPYSGQETNENRRTLQDGAHTSSKYTGPMIYRDSKGRMRTERHAYSSNGGIWTDNRPVPPDDFTAVEIHDPVAGFEYILDPVTHVAHRTAFKPGEPQEFTSAMLRPPGAPDSVTP